MGDCCNPCCNNNNGLFSGNIIWIVVIVILAIWLFGGNYNGNSCC